MASLLTKVRGEQNRRADVDLSQDIVAWAESNFYIEETEAPITFEPYQAALLRHIFTRNDEGRFPYTTILWSQPKKSGKTTIAAIVVRWAAEFWGKYGEVLCVGNDAKQAKERGFMKCAVSVELTPGFIKGRRELPDKWRLLTTEMQCLTSGTKVKAVATDYQGEAGANPSLIVWTELWGFIHTAALRFWAEMAPSPTKPDSITWIETYAGYEGESELLWQQYEAIVKNGRQLTAEEIGAVGCFEEAPNADSLVPCYVEEVSGAFAFWDEGTVARRMPWQNGELGRRYYAGEARRQTPSQMTRLHGNEWVSAESEFVDIVLWDLCTNPLPLVDRDGVKFDGPLVVALDAGVSNDSFGLVATSRDPDRPDDGVAVRLVHEWKPPKGGYVDFALVEKAIRELCTEFNVTEIAYDPYQLHDMCTRLHNEGVGWFRKFGQIQERLTSDKGLLDLIMQRRIRHDGDLRLRQHITNCNAKQAANEDTRLRLIKKSESRKIDLAVALSMAAQETLRLSL